MRIFWFTFIGWFCTATAFAGELVLAPETDEQGAGLVYEFTECVRPPAPTFKIDPRSKGSIRRAERNRAVDQYNEHVKAANSYMRCLADEAQRDLEAYYAAVSTALDEAQASMMDGIETSRKSLNDK